MNIPSRLVQLRRWIFPAFVVMLLILLYACMEEPAGIIIPCNQPQGLTTYPAKGDTNVPLDPVITVKFDTIKKPISFDSTSIILTHGNDTIGGTVSYNPTDTTLSFTPIDTLKPGTPYIVVVTVPTDSTIPGAGGPLGPPITVDTTYTWTFTTEDTAPACISWLPQSPAPTNPVLSGVTLRSVYFGNVGSHGSATQIGHIVGFNGTIRVTQNAGADGWPAQSPPTANATTDLYAVNCPYSQNGSDNKCYVVGANGTILSSASATTPGTTWSAETESPAITSTLRAVFCGSLASNLCIAVGDGGTILRKTTSSGPWVKYTTSPTAQQLSSVSCLNLSFPDIPANYMCYASGNNGTFLKSMNGGNTWALIPIPGFTTVNFNSVYLWPIPVGVAWMAGDNGTLLLTEDSAATWTTLAPGTGTASLNSVDFGGNKDGWTVGNGGAISGFVVHGIFTPGEFLTKPWAAEQSTPHNANTLYSVSTPDTCLAWSVGTNATILKKNKCACTITP